jgi:hypothetical protein
MILFTRQRVFLYFSDPLFKFSGISLVLSNTDDKGIDKAAVIALI